MNGDNRNNSAKINGIKLLVSSFVSMLTVILFLYLLGWRINLPIHWVFILGILLGPLLTNIIYRMWK